MVLRSENIVQALKGNVRQHGGTHLPEFRFRRVRVRDCMHRRTCSSLDRLLRIRRRLRAQLQDTAVHEAMSLKHSAAKECVTATQTLSGGFQTAADPDGSNGLPFGATCSCPGNIAPENGAKETRPTGALSLLIRCGENSGDSRVWLFRGSAKRGKEESTGNIHGT